MFGSSKRRRSWTCFVAAAMCLPPVLEISAREVDENALVRVLIRKSVEAFHAKDFSDAGSSARNAWDACADTTSIIAAVAAANLGAVHAIHGRLPEALQQQDRSLSILLQRDAPETLGRLLVARAITLALLDRRPQAGKALEQARQLLGVKDWASAFVEAAVGSYFGDPLSVQAGYMAFRGLAAEAVESGDSARVAQAAMVLGLLEGNSGDARAAARFYARAYAIQRANRDTTGMILSQRNRGLANYKLRKYERSREALQSSLDLAASQGDRLAALRAHTEFLFLYTATREFDRAREADRQAGRILGSLFEDLSAGRQTETLLVDTYQLVLLQYQGKSSFTTDIFSGILDQLVLEGSER